MRRLARRIWCGRWRFLADPKPPENVSGARQTLQRPQAGVPLSKGGDPRKDRPPHLAPSSGLFASDLASRRLGSQEDGGAHVGTPVDAFTFEGVDLLIHDAWDRSTVQP